MIPAWLKASTLMLLAIALMASPCRNCAPVEQAQAPAHDCCPKPKPVQPCHKQDSPRCSWQPNDALAQVEKEVRITASINIDATAGSMADPAIDALSCGATQPLGHAGSPPGAPVYLFLRALRR